MILFNYHETDDASVSIYGMDFGDVRKLIKEHNEYFNTDYQTIAEFNESESVREIEIEILWDNTEAIKGETLDEMNIATKLCLLSER